MSCQASIYHIKIVALVYLQWLEVEALVDEVLVGQEKYHHDQDQLGRRRASLVLVVVLVVVFVVVLVVAVVGDATRPTKRI